MKVVVTLMLLVLFVAVDAGAAVVVDDANIQWGSDNLMIADYAGTIVTDSRPGLENFTSTVLFDYDATTIRAVAMSLGVSSQWYLVQAGDEFSPATVAANAFPVILDPDATTEMPGPLTAIPLGDVYLGIHTRGMFDGLPENTVQENFGWLRLNNSGSALTMLDNAIAYADRGTPAGIYVGTSTAVPEPAALGLLAIGAIATRRRDRRSSL